MRLILIGVVFALVLPGVAFFGILLDRVAQGERVRSRELGQATAIRTAEAIDRELGSLIAALTTLATSPALDADDLTAFHLQARAVSLALHHDILLIDAAGRVVTGSRDVVDGRVPRIGSLDTAEHVVQTGEPAVSGLFTSRVTHQPSVAVDVPVLRAGAVRYVLALSLRASTLNEILGTQALPAGWIASVNDSADHVIARTLNAESAVGGLASADFRRLAVGDSATWIGSTLEGTEVLAAMQRQRLADWRIAVGVPISAIEAPLRGTVTLLGLMGAVTLAIAALLAWRLADTVAGPLRALARAGDSLGQGIPVPRLRSGIAEVDAVSRALVQATQDLRARADALAAERAQLAAVIDTIPVGLAIADAPRGTLVSGNKYLNRLFNDDLRFGADSPADYRWEAYHADGRLVDPEEYPRNRVLAGASRAELICLHCRRDASAIWVQLIAAPIRGPDGETTGVVITVLDIDDVVRAREAETRAAERLEAQVVERTAALEAANQRLRDEIQARAAAEDQLRQAQKMEAVGQLTGGIAHDFNNLLTIIIGNLDLLRRRTPDGADFDRTRRLLDNALEGSNRAATLVARLLAFSRRQPLAPQPVDANGLVAGMADLLHRTLGDAVAVETTLAPDLWRTHVDANQLENTLVNLAVNGRDAMLASTWPGGTLTIATANVVLGAADLDPDAEPGEYVRIAVTDQGIGMSHDVAARVFEPFFTTKPQGQGTGLGLSQVHGFVKQSGGHVGLRTAPGSGTTVTIDLPRFTGQDRAAVAGPAGRAAEHTPHLAILVVEDEPIVRRTSTEALRELGHTVIHAGDAEAGLHLLDLHPEIGLLFTDVMLPKMSGPLLAMEARRRRPGLPILFTSGYTGEAADQPVTLVADSLMLHKPFTMAELARSLDEAVQAANAAS